MLDIAALSVVSHQAQTAQTAQILVLKKAMDTQAANQTALLQIAAASPAHLGNSVDIRI